MTAKTSEKLAKRLDEVGLDVLATRARDDFYHDYFSPLTLPSVFLERELRDARDACDDAVLRVKIEDIRQDHLNGEFDADFEESEEWAKSPEGQDTFDRLIKDKP